MNVIRVEQVGRGWKWATAFVGCTAMLVSLSPATKQASADVASRTGRLEKMIVRAVPGHVAEAERLVTASGGVVGRNLSIISGFAADVPVDAAQGLRAATTVVSSVDVDTAMKPLSVDPALGYDATGDEGSLSSVTKMVGAQTLWAAGYTGKGVDVALIDTGVAPVTGLSDKIVNGPDLSLDYQYGLAESVDAYGHGTHMAGIIAGRDPGATATSSLSDPTRFVGVAPDARIVNVKVGAADGSTDVSQVIAGIDWVVQHRSDNGLNIKVLNLSFGTISGQPYTVDPLAFAAEVAWKHGVVVVAAAGNDGLGIKQLADPAYDPRILAVGATDPNNSTQSKNWMPADFTNAGSSKRDADLFAPGLHILSLRDPGSYVDTNYPNSVVGTRFTRGSGTSQAAAVTSGLVADLFQKYPTATPDQIKNALIESTIEFKTGSFDPALKALADHEGTVNASKAISRTTLDKATQNFTAATGTGSLETARGGLHLSNGTTELTGEYDIFGNAGTLRPGQPPPRPAPRGTVVSGTPAGGPATPGPVSGGRTPPGPPTTGPDNAGAASGGRVWPGTDSVGAASGGATQGGRGSAGAATPGRASGGAARSGLPRPGNSRPSLTRFRPQPMRAHRKSGELEKLS